MVTPGKNDETSATTFTTPSDLEIVARRVVNAPRQLVWDAHTDPRHVPRWMTGPADWSMPVCEIDLRVGGEWHWVWRGPDGSQMEMRGVYREITPPERLVNTESWGGDWPETINTLILSEQNGRTTIVSKVLYPSREALDRAVQTGMKEGWSESYDRLDQYLSTIARPAAG